MNRRQSLLESYRALSFTYATALWLLRLATGDRDATVDDVVGIVVALERGQGMPSVARAATAINGSGQLERLLAWLAR